jgi:hypothetical protein
MLISSDNLLFRLAHENLSKGKQLSDEKTAFVFAVRSKHGAESGTPPQISGDVPERYYGYFENQLREQLIFVYDYKTQKGTLWMGDLGWNEPKYVIDGKVLDLMMDRQESLWLQLCWNTAIAGQVK